MQCSSPQVTTCSTASNTLSQEVRKHSAVSFHERRRAQRARKSIYAFVKVRLPSPQGTSSTATTPQRRQSTRRIAYSRKTKNPHRGVNSKRRSASWSYPGAGKWQREQTAAEPLRGRRTTSMLLLSVLKRACS